MAKEIEFSTGNLTGKLNAVYVDANLHMNSLGLKEGSIVEDRFGGRWKLVTDPSLSMSRTGPPFGPKHATFNVYARCHKWLKSNRWGVRESFHNLVGWRLIDGK